MLTAFRLGTAVLLLAIMAQTTSGVQRENFKKCENSSFCRRCRKVEPGKTPYELLPDTLSHKESTLHIELYNKVTGVYYRLELTALKNDLFRLYINEKSPLHPRYEVEYALKDHPQTTVLQLVEKTSTHITVKNGKNKAILHVNPFKVDFYVGNQLVISTNDRGFMRFEHLRTKPPAKPDQPQQVEENAENAEKPAEPAADQPDAPQFPGDGAEDDPGAWEENYKSHHDEKPLGPEAVAMDFSFPGAEQAYGIPEHADSFALKSTKQTDPYRLYNLDVFEYEINEKMSLYGAIPVLYAHGKETTSGIYWNNAAETWVDITSSADNDFVKSLVNMVSGTVKKPQVDAHIMSESGVIDVFILLGPTPMDVFKQFASLTGTANLPPIFSLGYHQSRWNYNDEEDVNQVATNFDKYDIPMDVMWLDIEYTDGKRYFTWDKLKFPHPLEMVKNLTEKGRKLVVIIDPHIKRASDYFLHNDATDNGYYVKSRDGKDYEGWCWPGSSSYLDFFDPKVREYYSGLYDISKFEGTTNDVHIWNDMNEPSVFNGPEITMPKDLVHYGNWEHRDVHNIYGLVYTMSTYEALFKRSGGALRPFVLTRAFFAGSQRFAAVWTGDNMAEWEHLRISYPMCLSLAISGISFCGADVGGFFKNPDAELLTRWYQAGAWLPFFRQHAHIDTKRREPWTYNDDLLNNARDTLRLRYSYLPYWYTLFREHEVNGTPVIRPIWAHYPTEISAFTIDDQILVGDAILVRSIYQPAVSEVSVYFPGEGKVAWYDIETYKMYLGKQIDSVSVTIHRIPVFQREGTIVPRKMRIRRSTVAMRNDPYTLVVIADGEGRAQGNLYIDDESSFEYRHGKYLYLRIKLDGKKLTSTFLENLATYDTKSSLERVDIVNPPKDIKKAVLHSKAMGNVDLETKYNPHNNVLTVRKPTVKMGEEWIIDLIA
ncbi:neutral alpha-glucosidase AB isoform X2 [Copidosoma floridanum]|uniref:neutral alpha-glucosidase AB isoform X2 n=1 Tax=Copidosoma floridanum TaxID=29053 RepID=UPI0006C9D2C7|nr:neutral alpha-glucosidase AB isoform X2 [Copidosoma floridanum]